MIHTCGSFASIFRHSSNGYSFAAKRASEESLQGFHPAPIPFLSRFRESHLQLPYDAMRLSPVNAVPGQIVRGERRCNPKFLELHTHLLLSFSWKDPA